MSTLFAGQADSESQRPIGAKESLCEVFRAGEKPADRFGIGIEYERLPVSRETGRAGPYAAEAPTGVAPAARGRSPKAFATIERFLGALAEKGGWHAEREAGRAIALERRGTRVTIEPGAQIELSGRVHAGLAAARDEVMDFAREADEVASPMGIAFLGLGYHPFSEF